MGQKGDPKDHLANERTFLAWVRTAIGIMAFGFLIERAAILLKQMVIITNHNEQILSNLPVTEASIVGVLLVIIGVIISLLSLINYIQVTRQIEANTYRPSLFLSLILTLAVLLIGIFLTIYLL